MIKSLERLILATTNPGKVREIKRLLSDTGIEILTLDDIEPLQMPPEEGATFRENAGAKARFVAARSGFAALADDSGLEVDWFGGAPGVYSARYAGEGATDKENYRKLLEEMEGVEPASRGARFRCVVSLALPDGTVVDFDGSFEGVIADGASGDGGFGYDPVFFIPGEGKTAAELTAEEKNSMSHRAKALEKLKSWLIENGKTAR